MVIYVALLPALELTAADRPAGDTISRLAFLISTTDASLSQRPSASDMASSMLVTAQV